MLHQAGISRPFDGADGYGTWFWGLTPSCLTSLLRTAGFAIDRQDDEPFAQTIVATPQAVPFEHRLPTPLESRQLAEEISASGLARPA